VADKLVQDEPNYGQKRPDMQAEMDAMKMPPQSRMSGIQGMVGQQQPTDNFFTSNAPSQQPG